MEIIEQIASDIYYSYISASKYVMPTSKIPGLLRFAIYYAIGIFAAGFILGTIRTIVLLPVVGALSAVCIEIPLMWLASWLYAHYLTKRLNLSRLWYWRLLSGAIAFTILMAIEVSVALFIFRQSTQFLVKGWQTLPGLLGLLAQIVFGFIPLVQSCLLPLDSATGEQYES
ncbi:MAG TPA: hypothetical protein VK174_12380 [Chitinophagales bacterium]|nr:hypothetical protein [Chitinophagales bacterium]